MPALKTQTVPALDRAISILELLAQSRHGLSLPEIVEQSGLPRSTVHYLVVTLERRGYLQKNERTTRYMFGVGLVNLANSAISGLTLRQKAAPYLQNLVRRTHLTAHLGIRSNHEALLIARHDPPGGPCMASWIGKRMPIHCTAIGKVLAAYLPSPELDLVIREHGLPRHNDNTIAMPRKLQEEFAKVVKLGYAVDNEEDEIGTRCIGAPVFDAAGQVIAAVSIAGMTAEINDANFEALLRETQRTARELGPALCEPCLPESSRVDDHPARREPGIVGDRARFYNLA